MRAWEVGPSAGIEGLRCAGRPEPVASAGELVVRTLAAGLNFRDLMVLRGQYASRAPEDRVPLSDGVGVVEQAGGGVGGISAGDRVIVPNFLGWIEGRFSPAAFARDMGVTADGWLAEKVVLPAEAAIPVPSAMSDTSAATLSVVAATVWHAMVAFARVQPGELVLAQGTGGVSVFALQLARALGAQVAITSSSETKLARARELGADYTVNYRERPDWAAALLEATGGRGADVVVDTLGFAALGETLAACAPEARIGTIGALSGRPQDTAGASQGLIIAKNLTIKGIASGSRAMLRDAVQVLAAKGVELEIDREFAFDEAPAAYRHLESGGHFGKVLIRVS